jgi:hypothetical protein
VTSGVAPQEAEIERVNDELNDGLRTCRSVLNDYRAILSGKTVAANDAIGTDGSQSMVEAWRTQEDSNL